MVRRAFVTILTIMFHASSVVRYFFNWQRFDKFWSNFTEITIAKLIVLGHCIFFNCKFQKRSVSIVNYKPKYPSGLSLSQFGKRGGFYQTDPRSLTVNIFSNLLSAEKKKNHCCNKTASNFFSDCEFSGTPPSGCVLEAWVSQIMNNINDILLKKANILNIPKCNSHYYCLILSTLHKIN